jgi:hypothetical protein
MSLFDQILRGPSQNGKTHDLAMLSLSEASRRQQIDLSFAQLGASPWFNDAAMHSRI